MVASLSALLPHEKVCQFRDKKCPFCPHIASTEEERNRHVSQCPHRVPCIARCLSRHDCTGVVGRWEYFQHVKQAGCGEARVAVQFNDWVKFLFPLKRIIEDSSAAGLGFKAKDVGKMWSFLLPDGERMYFSVYRVDSSSPGWAVHQVACRRSWLVYLAREGAVEDEKDYRYVVRIVNNTTGEGGNDMVIRKALSLEESVPSPLLFDHKHVVTVSDEDVLKIVGGDKMCSLRLCLKILG